MMPDRFTNEEDVKAAYEAAEFVAERLVQMNVVLVPDERQPAKGNTIRKLAWDIADAVIRSGYVDGDITDLPGVQVERIHG